MDLAPNTAWSMCNLNTMPMAGEMRASLSPAMAPWPSFLPLAQRAAPVGLTVGSHSPSAPNHRVPASPPHPTACTGLFSDGNLISLHCTSNTSHPCKNQSELVGGGAAQPAFAPAHGFAPGLLPEPPQGQNAHHWALTTRRSAPIHAMPWGAAALQQRGLVFVTRSRCTTAAGDIAAVSGHLHRFQVPRLKAGFVIKSKKCATSVVFHFPFSTSSLPAAHRR